MNVTIDGGVYPCEEGQFILDVARRNGIPIPTLCHHPAVPGRGCCRICIVETIERGRHKIVTSCMYPIRGEIEVLTGSERVVRERRMLLSLLRARAPESERIADLARLYDAPDIPIFVTGDTTKCVLCGLCVAICRTIGSGAIASIMRGTEKRIATPYDEISSECIGCGSCANICPTGNIEMVETADTRTIWYKSFDLATCAECGKTIGTPETIAHSAANTKTEPQVLCEECRKRKTAETLADAWPFSK